MDITRKAHREAQEATLQYRSRQEAMLDDELIEDKLTQLLDFVDMLKRTPEGTAEIQRRVRLFGDCKRSAGETSGEFYAKLRHWLDRDNPRTKSPRRAPRQTEGGRRRRRPTSARGRIADFFLRKRPVQRPPLRAGRVGRAGQVKRRGN